MSKWGGLEICNINTRTEEGKNILNLEDYSDLERKIADVFKNDGFAAAYLDYKVLIGKYCSKAFVFYNSETFHPRYLQRLRVFNGDKELLIWRQGEGRFKMRLRIDGEGEPKDCVRASQVLWGTKSESLGSGWCRIYEDRGVELILPIDDPELDKGEGKRRVKILTHNYIDFIDETGQAGYVDCRFVRFEGGGKEE
jgi:CRISPR-associated protein (TIGR03984 family)